MGRKFAKGWSISTPLISVANFFIDIFRIALLFAWCLRFLKLSPSLRHSWGVIWKHCCWNLRWDWYVIIFNRSWWWLSIFATRILSSVYQHLSQLTFCPIFSKLWSSVVFFVSVVECAGLQWHIHVAKRTFKGVERWIVINYWVILNFWSNWPRIS